MTQAQETVPDRRSEVLDVAAEFFSVKGYRVTTLNDIADRLGFTRAALYYYFASKQEILTAIIDTAGRAMLEALRSAQALDLAPSERLRRIVTAQVQTATVHPHLFGVYLAEKPSLAESDRARLEAGEREYVLGVAGVLEAGIAAGEFAPVPSLPAAMLLMGMVSWTPRWYRPTGELSGEDLADLIYTFFFAGLQQGWKAPVAAPSRPRSAPRGR